MLRLLGMKKIIGIIIIGLILVAGYILVTKEKEPTITTERNAVAATVNGETITGDEVRVQIERITSYQGTRFFDMNDEDRQRVYSEALDTLIKAEVLAQTVRGAGVSVSSEAIDASISAFAEAMGGLAALEATLEREGKDLRDLRQEMKESLLNQAYFDSILPLGEITISEEEIVSQFNTWVKNAEASQEPVPTFEEARPIIEAELRGLEREVQIRAHIDELLSAADIKKS